jgi:uncharacterized Fe-S cluster protein YjdI
MTTDKTKEYSNGEIAITWKQDVCIHSANCIRNLPGVFNPRERPWIKIKNADTPQLIEAVDKCPSGALTWQHVEPDASADQAQFAVPDNTTLSILKDGPILVKGGFEMIDDQGNVVQGGESVALCRCGSSANKPFCDGSHKKSGFKG